jgi:hypothetical protein
LAQQLKENGEAFLSEVLIRGKHFSNVSFAHRVHGDAVGAAIALVGASFVEGQTGNKVFMSMTRGFPLLGNGLLAHDPRLDVVRRDPTSSQAPYMVISERKSQAIFHSRKSLNDHKDRILTP